jgi:acyl carrier protein
LIQKQAEQSSSLSAFGLSEIAQQAGYKVEISWARQYSHHGGFDAIFHRYQLPQPGRGRIMFRFPTDHQHQSTRLWCSQPLQQQVKQEIKQQLQDQLQAQLPSYMVPQVITILEMMPVNENGKVDRRALTTNVQRRTAARPSLRQPSSEAQRQMQNIWAQVLKLDPVSIGLDDSFFQLGGDSLAAMRVVGEARRLRLKITVADIFRQPSLEAAANHEGTSTNEAVRQIPKSLLNGSVKQSFAQGRLWFVEQLYPGLTWYLMPCAMKLRGSIQLDALKIALSSLERRHETLRTTFSSQDGVGVQTVHSFNPTELRVVDIEDETALAHALNRDQTTPFDLTSESG